MTLDARHDPMGQAILDFYEGKSGPKLTIRSPFFEDDEMPIDELFRTREQMPAQELLALRGCEGRILDVGAGAGCHTLELQSRGKEVTAIDISPLAVETMRRRGVKDARVADFFADDFGKDYDVIAFFMNGLGIAGTLDNLPNFLKRCESLLAKDGIIIAESADLSYVYTNDEGELEWDSIDGFYGELKFQMVYGDCEGKEFSWLYVDKERLAKACEEVGLEFKVIYNDHNNHSYMAHIFRKNEANSEKNNEQSSRH